jgi:hypothetical protein
MTVQPITALDNMLKLFDNDNEMSHLALLSKTKRKAFNKLLEQINGYIEQGLLENNKTLGNRVEKVKRALKDTTKSITKIYTTYNNFNNDFTKMCNTIPGSTKKTKSTKAAIKDPWVR